jgi:uncharacterized protein
MENAVKQIGKDVVGTALFGGILLLFLFGDRLIDPSSVPKEVLNVSTLFLSIILEAIPFILLGVFASALIQTFISEDTLKRFIPKHPILALVPAAIVGAFLPICECAIIPVVRRLVLKGMPLHLGVVIMVTAPILNPVVFASTYYAFQTNMHVVYARMGLAFVASIVIGAIIYFLFRTSLPLKKRHHSHEHHHHSKNRWLETLSHASDEFFDVGRYLIVGALVASVFQASFDRTTLLEIGGDQAVAPAVMMGLAYILSLCSEADAFVASSFGSTFTTGSLVAFLVYGPMIDLKNTFMLFAYFKPKFVVVFIFVVTAVIYGSIILLQSLNIL